VQGTGPNGLLTTLYFDKVSGLLLRMVRYGRTPIGRVPTQIDFADYRDVGGAFSVATTRRSNRPGRNRRRHLALTVSFVHC